MTELLATWVDEELNPGHVPDPGLTLGLGVFETLTVLAGRPFALERHLDRMVDGARRLALPRPDLNLIRSAVAGLSEQGRHLAHARLRLTWTAGGTGSGSLLGTLAHYDAPTAVTVELSRYRRNEASAIAGIKCTSFAENTLALQDAQDRGADEALLANSRGELSEGATSNVFVELGGELHTPPLSSGCLPGTTRALCLEWGRAAGLPIRQTSLPFDVMNVTPHAAITSALKGVVPIQRVGTRPLRTGHLTLQLAEIYFRRRQETLDRGGVP